LDNDRQLAFALTRAIEIAGEAASRVSAEFRASTHDVPWQEIISTRNRLVHAYFEVDLDILWTAATVESPIVLRSVRQLLRQA
ncbi:MAG: HepT-like ribonuclease domain-containing protein, partial [Terriglobales bacterium]